VSRRRSASGETPALSLGASMVAVTAELPSALSWPTAACLGECADASPVPRTSPARAQRARIVSTAHASSPLPMALIRPRHGARRQETTPPRCPADRPRQRGTSPCAPPGGARETSALHPLGATPPPSEGRALAALPPPGRVTKPGPRKLSWHMSP